jgi:hypothetical protein
MSQTRGLGSRCSISTASRLTFGNVRFFLGNLA